MDLNDKIGWACFHDMPSAIGSGNVQRAINFTKQAGGKYLRPAFALQDSEYNTGKAWGWRVDPYKMIIDSGLKVVFGAYPQQLKGHAYDSNISSMVDKAVIAYANILDNLLSNGISPDDVVVEAWNEADEGFFLLKNEHGSNYYENAYTDPTVINSYLEFNARLFEEAHKRGFEYLDLCSVKYPSFFQGTKLYDLYNAKLSSYSAKPDRISFHPYVVNGSSNAIPEFYLGGGFDFGDYNNIKGIQIGVTEFGLPSVEWGNPFSGKWAYQYARDIFIRQVIIMDYLNVDPMIIYSCNANPDPADADNDSCWGVYQYDKSTNKISMTDLGKTELSFFQSMKGYHLHGIVTPNSGSIDSLNYPTTTYAFEYENQSGHKKLFYWNPSLVGKTQITWNNQKVTLNYSQHVQVIES